MNRFDDKVVLITGGTRGIGRACAEAFAGEGAKVAICGRSAETADAAAKEIAGEVQGFQADISIPDSVNALVKSVRDTLGPVNILVNNAGITRDGLILRMKDGAWADVIDTNLSGTFYCCRAAARDMLKLRGGRIINLSSVVGVHGQGGQTNYCASKAGIIGFSKALAQEFAPRNITVNVVCPGYIETDMTGELAEETRRAIVERIPLGRPGRVQDVADAILFLASDAAAYITGHVLTVDGGMTM